MNQSNDDQIPIIQPTLPPWEDVAADLRAVWENPKLTVGEFVRRFEAEAERRLDVPHAVAVASCTSGLMLCARALGLTGEAILPPFTWTATGEALLWNGVTPVFADVTPGTYTLDPAAVERAITPRTSAIVPVTVFGVPPDIDALEDLARRRGLKVLYDSAQGLGSSYRGRMLGGFGDVEVFSLSPTKVVTAVELGLITTRDGDLAARLRRMRDYGKAADGVDIDLLGLSCRPSELHGLVGWHNLRRVDALVAARQRLMARYRERLSGLLGVSFQDCPAERATTGNYMTIFVREGEAALDRDGLYVALAEAGVQTKKYFYPALHLQTVFAASRAAFEGRLPVAERASREGLALPLFSHMTEALVDRVCEAVLAHLGGRA